MQFPPRWLTMVKFPAGVHIKIEVGVDGNKKNTGGLKRTAVPIGTKAIKKEDDAPVMKKQKISIHVECTTADVADVAPRKPFWRRPFKSARPGIKFGAKQQLAIAQRQNDELDRQRQKNKGDGKTSSSEQMWNPKEFTTEHEMPTKAKKLVQKLREKKKVYSCPGCSKSHDPIEVHPKNLYFTQKSIWHGPCWNSRLLYAKGVACPRCAVWIAHDTYDADDIYTSASGCRWHMACWLADVQEQKRAEFMSVIEQL